MGYVIQIFGKSRIWTVVLLFNVNYVLAADTSAVKLVSIMNGLRWELTNGFLGVVIPKNEAFTVIKSNRTLAPIQSIIYADGTYSDDSPNYLITEKTPLRVNVAIVKQTLSEVVITITYSFQKSKYRDNARDTIKYLNDDGPGFYKTKIIMKRNARSVLIEEESNYDIYYSIKITNGLHPDKARYRGWFAYTAADGYEPDGSVYKGEDTRGGHNVDATVDIKYQQYTPYRRMSLWEVAGGEVNTGRYWQFFNSSAPNSANLLGVFQGRASRLYGGNFGGVQLLILPEESKRFVAELGITIYRKAPDLTWMPRRRFQWGLFVSTKKDLLPPDKIQPIGIELNRVSGLANKIDNYAEKSAKLHPSFFTGSVYLPPQQIQELIKKVKTDPAFFDRIAKLDPYFKPVLDAWRSAPEATKLVNTLIDMGDKLKRNFKIGDGSYEFDARYWKGAMRFQQAALQVSCIFADKSIAISASQREKLMQLVRMMARIVWDDDHVPMFDSAEVNYGNGNMYLQYNNNGRSFFALLFAADPEFVTRARNVASNTEKQIQMALYESGASFSCPHYTQVAMDPLLQVMLQLKQAGIKDFFASSIRVRKFADFYCSLLTPPSLRFSGYRKLISFGDGAEESAVTFALLGAGFSSIDKNLSDRMYYLYENGPRRPAQFGYIALLFDLSHSHRSDYTSSTANYQGYLSVFRSAVNTNEETAVWFLTGDSLIDHRQDDRGELAIYALKTPLSLHWSSLYYPHVSGSAMKSVVLPFKKLPQWNALLQPTDATGSGYWRKAYQAEFVQLGKSASSTSIVTGEKKWKRQISLLTVSGTQPIIVIKDSLEDVGPNIWSMTFMSHGAIATSDGKIVPKIKRYDNSVFREFPEASTETSMNAGWNFFQFEGQEWAKQLHPAGGIDWYLYMHCNDRTSFTASEWSNNWQNDIEKGDFFAAYKRNYEESQQILRVKGGREFFSVILPYNKGSNLYRNVRHDALGKLLIPVGKNFVTLTTTYYYYESGNDLCFGTLASEAVSENGFSIKGGYAEIEKTDKIIVVRIHGNTGVRTIQLPFHVESAGSNKETLVSPVGKSSQIRINYKNINSRQGVLATEKNYNEYTFRIK